ncbi:MAG: arylesterase [Rhodanobacteraceae bacterium]
MRRIVLVILLMVPVAVSAARPGPLLVLGDSLSAAQNIALSQGWVHQLAERLAALHTPRQVINASISGETTASGRNRLPALLRQYKPGIVIIELGANDGLRGLPLDEIRANLSAMIRASQHGGARVLLLGIELPVNYGPTYRDSLRGIYADLATQYHVRRLPFLLEGVALDPKLMQADGLHPNAVGERRVFDNIWTALQPMLESGSSAAPARMR